MKCSTAESMVNRYIKHTLTVDELSDFLEHIQTCSSCYEELETYFIVHAAMRQLDTEEAETVMDFQNLLEQDIRKSRIYVRRRKGLRVLGVFGIVLLIFVLLAFFGFVIF